MAEGLLLKTKIGLLPALIVPYYMLIQKYYVLLVFNSTVKWQKKFGIFSLCALEPASSSPFLWVRQRFSFFVHTVWNCLVCSFGPPKVTPASHPANAQVNSSSPQYLSQCSHLLLQSVPLGMPQFQGAPFQISWSSNSRVFPFSSKSGPFQINEAVHPNLGAFKDQSSLL